MPSTPVQFRIFATGVTIDKIYFDRKNDHHVGAPGVVDVLEEAGVTFTCDVGSLIRKDSLDQTDAEFNIGFAAAAVQLLPPGVYRALHGHIFTPEHVRKNVAKNRFEEDSVQ